MKTFIQFIHEHMAMPNPKPRFGQHFCNLYIKEPWPELYNEESNIMAEAMIAKWLKQHQYWPNMPQPLET